MKKQAVIRIKTPAKITPYLRILARRADGFHDVRIVLLPVSLFDVLEFERNATKKISLHVEAAEPLGAVTRNLVYRAAMAFRRASGVRIGLTIKLSKHIPAGAGLGGGSGNAAGTLVALNALCGHPLDAARLFELAVDLGSDVPFFLSPAPALAQGRGEKLQPLPAFPAVPLLVVKPPFSVSTAEAYAQTEPRGPAGHRPPLGTLAEVRAALRNDLEQPVFRMHPELSTVRGALLDAGAVGALLTGSGSALFGLFADRPTRDAAAKALADEPAWRVLSCEPLPSHSYLPDG
jgi:4-diphosphocytidyl-2-C-methyl-D-erythritol kinase